MNIERRKKKKAPAVAMLLVIRIHGTREKNEVGNAVMCEMTEFLSLSSASRHRTPFGPVIPQLRLQPLLHHNP